MDAQLLLFILRLISAALLLGIVAVIFIALWRDYQHSVTAANVQRRIYGQLVELHTEASESAVDETGVIHPLLPLTSIGRAPSNTIPIEDDFASSEHALLALRQGQWWLEDRDSRNGTSINGLVISKPVVVTDGDVIGVGGRRFRIDLDR
ncbi:MAG: FHA domain-containing protein [Chloroflexota bacterium]|nr:FHA domain-containing protein [Chloroflexota bacterium]